MASAPPLTPFDILRRTPKSNCGKCGHLTCLAFAAAVATSNFPPEKCPFINLGGLQIKKSTAPSPAAEKDQALVRHLKEKIFRFDFRQIHTALGAGWTEESPDLLRFSYLGRNVCLSKSGVEIDEQAPKDPRDLILLYNYVHSRGGQKPTSDWVGMESLPNSISKVRTLAVYCEDRLARLFSEHETETLIKAGKALHGIVATDTSAALGMIIPVLPRVPLYILYWQSEPEDGFEAKVKVLFDRQVMNFLDLESLVFTAERLAEQFKKTLEGS